MKAKEIFFILFLFILPFLVRADPVYRPPLTPETEATSEKLGFHWYGRENEQYGVYYKGDEDSDYIFHGATTTPSIRSHPLVYYLDDLEAGTVYSFKVRVCDDDFEECFDSDACLSSGKCLYSFPISLYTNPGVPAFDYERSATIINIFFQPVKGALSYQIAYKAESEDNFRYVEASNLEYLINNLIPDTRYNFKVQACNDRKADRNEDGEYDEGCSGFGRTISVRTTKEKVVADLVESYEKKNLRLQKTLSQYLDYINKYEYLSPSTRSDFAGEIINSEGRGVLDLLRSDLTAVKTETRPGVIEEKINDLDSNKKEQLELLKYKLKIYKKCDGYYKQLNGFREKVGGLSEIPAQAQDNFTKESGYIGRIKSHYENNYEKKVLSWSLLPTASLGEKLAFIKDLYKNISKDNNYKAATIVYKTFYNISKINSQLEGFKDYAVWGNKKYLLEAFFGYYPPENKILFTDKFLGALDDFRSYYGGYVLNKSWTSYETVYNDYNHLRANTRHKQAIAMLNSFKKINSILAKVENYNTKINSPENFSGISPEIKAKGANLRLLMRDALLSGDNSCRRLAIDNPGKAYQEIGGYFGHKIFVYFYNGAKLFNDLSIKTDNLEKVLEAIGECPAAENNLETARAGLGGIEGKLKAVNINDLDKTKREYSEIRNIYREGINYYKAAVSEAKNCL
ncbi:MAG: fibronectin type III domain-containing protein [Patescibacteria group bacterium]|nr:fibronectin type III domain-containing protein [Patescibacteria group bacterium]